MPRFFLAFGGKSVISVTTFDSTAESLLDLLQRVKTGDIQLPDFQRDWVWDEDRIQRLKTSVFSLD